MPMRSSRDPEAVGIAYAVEDELLNRALTFAAAFGSSSSPPSSAAAISPPDDTRVAALMRRS